MNEYEEIGIDLDLSGIDIETETDEVRQYPEDEWYNTNDSDPTPLLQSQVPDLDMDELLELELELEDLDLQEVEAIVRELEEGAEDVPYEYMYWLHGADEFADDAPSAPPESGDVDPETGEVVP